MPTRPASALPARRMLRSASTSHCFHRLATAGGATPGIEHSISMGAAQPTRRSASARAPAAAARAAVSLQLRATSAIRPLRDTNDRDPVRFLTLAGAVLMLKHYPGLWKVGSGSVNV